RTLAAASRLLRRRPPTPTLFPYTTLFRSSIVPSPGFGNADSPEREDCFVQLNNSELVGCEFGSEAADAPRVALIGDSHAYQYIEDRKSTRLNSSHVKISYAVFCLKKQKPE